MSNSPIWFQTIVYIFVSTVMLALVLGFIFIVIVLCWVIFLDRTEELKVNRRLRRIALEQAEKEGVSDD